MIESITTERLRLEPLTPAHAEAMAAYQRRNREHLAPSSPRRAPEFYEAEYWRRRAPAEPTPLAELSALSWVLRMREAAVDAPVIGTIDLSNIVRGPFCACYLGYALDHEHVGRGLMTEGLRAALPWVFEHLRLNRVMANYLPQNRRSEAVLHRLGFVREGYARDYLFIDGAWRDHILTALRSPDPPTPGG